MRRHGFNAAVVLQALALVCAPLAFAASNSSALPSTAASTSTNETLSLDQDWRFHLGDIPFPVIQGHGMTYANAKAGQAWGAAAPDYDDTNWRQLDLPHDWVVEGPFDPKANVSQGYRPRGIAWYRRALKLDPTDRGRYLELQFDGIATQATIWFNGIVVQRNWSGYNSSYIDITPFAKYGNELNSIVVRVDANPMEGWWYEGGGIYRHTWLAKRNPVHVITDGVYANPQHLSGNQWTVPVEVSLANTGKTTASIDVDVSVIDPQGKPVAQQHAVANVGALEDTVAKLPIAIESPTLWTLDAPALYEVRTLVSQNGKPIDRVTTRAGFRYFHFDANDGFSLNGKSMKIQGVCVHQDHAGVGVAVPDSLWEFRLRKLKELGANAVRCAHNAPAKEMLDAADRIGLLIMDENRNFNSSPEYMHQLEWMVRRDRNHPSVFLWSIFNEEPMQGTAIGYEMVRRMAHAVKQLDDTRPVTAAMSDGMFTPVNVSQAVDVVGINYQQDQYDRFHAEHPTQPMMSSEDTSAFMTRGEYHTDMAAHIMSSYDDEAAPWGATHRAGWKAIAERRFVAGGFVWTGFDYRGEPTPFSWPSAGSFFGIMDQAGFPKTAFYLHQAQWLHDRPVLHLIPHWNWPGMEGKPIKVMALSNADSVTLILNGKVVSEQKVDTYQMTTWQVPYAPGKLEAAARKDGQIVARTEVETTGAPARLQLLPDRAHMDGDGRDAEPVTVQVVDAQGRPVSTANLPVDFAISGGRIIGLGNGDPNSHEPEKGSRRNLFNGLAQVIVQSLPGSHGPLVLRANSKGLNDAQATIAVQAVAPIPAVPRTQAYQSLQEWQMSPGAATAPDPNVQLADNDMNSWANVNVGALTPYAVGPWRLYRTRFMPYAEVRSHGGRLVFKQLVGQAEVWLDGKRLARKESTAGAEFVVPLAAGEGERQLTVMIRSHAEEPTGLADMVTVESTPASSRQ